MKNAKFILPIMCLCSSISVLSHAEEAAPQISSNKIITVTDQGLEPRNLTMKIEDSIVFLLNQTNNSQMKIKVDFNGKETHCASSNLIVTKNRDVASAKPILPQDFALFCFHAKGSYPFKVSGVKGAPQGLSGNINVE